MDEYVGLPRGAPQSFGHYLSEHLYKHVTPGKVQSLDGAADPESEIVRYGALVEEGVDLCCMGIGENGHIAFNEPGQTDFGDPRTVRRVELDAASRLQQVHDGCFSALDDVPREALTLTVPALMAATHVVCTVPGPTKRAAVAAALWGPVAPTCPASALRNHPSAVLFLDRASWSGELE
jgi:glucosamine-6-phosphate deaminase